MKNPALLIVLVLVSALLSGKLYAQDTYTLSGTVSGLDGTGLELRSSTGETLSVSAGDTSFTFATPVPAGTYTGFTIEPGTIGPLGIYTVDYSYWVKVSSHPDGQACTVTTKGAGKMPSNDEDGILVECQTAYDFEACLGNPGLNGVGKCTQSWLQQSPSASMSCTADACICQTELKEPVFGGSLIQSSSEGHWFDQNLDNISGSYKIQKCNLWVEYCAENHYAEQGLSACLPCAAGTTRPAGDDPKGPSTACEVTYCPENQYVFDHVCTPCAGGTTNAAGDDAFGSDTQCDSTVTHEIWGWTESQVTVDFIADGGDWESEGLGIDAGDVVLDLDVTCSSAQASCAVGDCPPAPTAPDSPIIDGPLNVALTTENGYLLYEVHMDAEKFPEDIPQTGKGNPQVGKFETGGDWDILSPGSSWASDTDADLSDGTTYIALHGVVFIPNGCADYQDLEGDEGDGYYTSCEEGPFDTDVESCANELDHCSGEGAWVDGEPFNVGKKRSWAMYLEAEAADFCTWAKVCDSSDGNTCNN